jgi:hypothetical protein
MGGTAGKWIFTTVLILLGVAWVGGIAWVLYGMGDNVPPIQAQQGAASPTTVSGTPLPTKTFHLTMQTFPATPTDAWMAEHNYHLDSSAIPALDLHTDWVRYGPSTNIVLPAHALVTMTIENYDGQSPVLNPFVSHVQGTVGNTMTVNGETVRSLDPNVISHTFTIHSIPSSQQPWLYVSVPILGEPDDVEEASTDNGFPPQPEVMQFSFVTGDPGTYIWNCFDPCGWNYNGFGGPMQTRGYMSGTVVVQD